MRATAAQGKHPHTHYAALSDCDQGRAASLHPDGVPCPCQKGRKLRSSAVSHGHLERSLRSAHGLADPLRETTFQAAGRAFWPPEAPTTMLTTTAYDTRRLS